MATNAVRPVRPYEHKHENPDYDEESTIAYLKSKGISDLITLATVKRKGVAA